MACMLRMLIASQTTGGRALLRLTARFRMSQYKHNSSVAPSIDVTKPVSMVDEQLGITVRGLSAHQQVTVFAALMEAPAYFLSHAHVSANQIGEVDLTTTPSSSGSFQGIDGMGLLWSMVPAIECTPGSRMWKKDITRPFNVHIGVLDRFQKVESIDIINSGDAICSCVIERHYLSDHVTRYDVTSGNVRGALFVPKGGGKHPGVIDLFGSAGGLVEFRAALLASHGFTTLALAFFAYDDLPQNLYQLEMEYFDEAVTYLSTHANVDASRGIGVLGVSKGAEIALHIAAYNHMVSACVWINGTYFYQLGKHTYRGQDINVKQFDLELVEFTDEGFVFKACLAEPGNGDVIPVEQSAAHFLLLQSMDDMVIGDHHADAIATRLSNAGKQNYTVHRYAGAGHLLEPPYTPLNRSVTHKLVGATQLQGGNVTQHAQAQEQSWLVTLEFLHTHLSNTSKL